MTESIRRRVCECGHESCFHKAKESGFIVSLVGQSGGRSCMGRDEKGRDCQCLRFTEADNA